MKINKIILINNPNDLFGSSKELLIYEKKDSKPIDIFYMPNTKGKTLIFNALKYLFSFDRNNYIKKTNTYLEVKVYFELNNEEYIYHGSYRNFKIKNIDGEEVKNFGGILEKSLGMDGIDLKYHQTKRNTLKSLNRFVFLSYEGITDKEKENKISFINSNYDGGSKKMLLAYFLGADIDKKRFELISNIEYKRKFVEDNKKKFSPYEKTLTQIQIGKSDLSNVFNDLQEERIFLGDIIIALQELNKLKKDYITLFKDNKNDDINFLNNEINNLLNVKKDIETNISELKLKVKQWNTLEQSKYIGGVNNIFKSKKLIEYQKFKLYKSDLEKLDSNYGLQKIETYIDKNINTFISKFKLFLDDMYEKFIENLVEGGLLKKENITDFKNNIIFSEDELNIDIPFSTSEGVRKAIRVLTFMGLHIYALKEKKVRSIDISFYDTFIENTGKEYRSVIFDTIIEFCSDKKYKVPKLMLFISDIEKNNNASINEISLKYNEYINLIQSNGLDEIL